MSVRWSGDTVDLRSSAINLHLQAAYVVDLRLSLRPIVRAISFMSKLNHRSLAQRTTGRTIDSRLRAFVNSPLLVLGQVQIDLGLRPKSETKFQTERFISLANADIYFTFSAI